MLKESAGKPSVPFEFIPIYDRDYFEPHYEIDDILDFCNKRGYIIERYEDYIEEYYNLRYSLEWNYEHIYNNSKDLEDFKIIVGRVPMKVISHLRTHRAFSFIVESSRNKRYLNNVEFWYPSWWDKSTIDTIINEDDKILTLYRILSYHGNIKPEEATMGLSDRRLVYFVMAAWKNDPFAWKNLFDVCDDRTGIMSITNQTVNNIKKLIYENT